MSYDPDFFYSRLIRGELRSAMDYLRQFPEQLERYNKYISRFEKAELAAMADDPFLDGILRLYQNYYRDVFYLEMDREQASEHLRAGLEKHFGCGTLEELEEGALKRAFESCGYSFQGGRTGGYYGPYIWKHTENSSYEVELPEGSQQYRLRFLDGFISKSWLDHLSFGEVSTGGWADGDGIINCVKASYDTESEDFKVSLLKHEAQHELDLGRYKGISSAELEYRAKLVELIYSKKRDMLGRFNSEAADDPENGHVQAALWISSRIPAGSDGEQLRRRAIELFKESCSEMEIKYAGVGK